MNVKQAEDMMHVDTHSENRPRQERELAESLRYASYIQQAIFPSNMLISQVLPDHFIFYQSREMVSGDFYYVRRRNDLIFIAIGDCTGHGVPGAFMSILGITFLNEIIAHGNYTGAGSVLNQLREHVMEALCQTGEDNEQKDGIDMALCILDTRNNKLSFAGAINPVYIVRNQFLHAIQGDGMPVGVGAEEEKAFTTHTFDLLKDDMVYLFTDGFVDQFGGPDGKKFKYKTFRELLTGLSNLPLTEQKNKLKNAFEQWKGNLKQLDDVLVFGFRYQPPTNIHLV